MGYASTDDLDAYAVAAEDYNEIAFHTTDPGADPDAFIADGGGPYALSMGVAGAAGPTPGSQPATAGRDYSDRKTVVLNEQASWVSVRVSGSGRFRAFRMRQPLGPGTFPIVYGLAVTNKS